VADLVYHTLVLLAERGLDPSEVMDVLKERHSR
jgi:phosphoribosyl-ATP pyrophosphohydrolase